MWENVYFAKNIIVCLESLDFESEQIFLQQLFQILF